MGRVTGIAVEQGDGGVGSLSRGSGVSHTRNPEGSQGAQRCYSGGERCDQNNNKKKQNYDQLEEVVSAS